MSYSDFQNQPSSEKLTLAVLYASKRLMGWSVHSGSVYKLENFDVQAIVSIEDSGTAYTEVNSLGAVTASSFYNDRENKILYIQTAGSDHPNGRFLVLTFKLFFANAPVVLPHDLGSGFEVYWENMIHSTSQFGVEIDTVNQSSEAIEGSGTLTLKNDQSFWPAQFDKLTFENKPCLIYSYNRELEASEAKLLFKGTVEKRAYTDQTIKFSLKDLLSELRNPIQLSTIQELGERNPTELNLAKQRMVLGRVFGMRPVNLDAVNTGYPLTGTFSVTAGSSSLVGVGTQFHKELSPDDVITLEGVEYTIASITTDTSAALTEAYAGNTATGLSATVKPDQPKRWMNRVWKVAGHALREPTTTTKRGSTVTRLIVNSTADIFDGDTIYIGTLGDGESATVDKVVNDNVLKLSTSLNVVPSSGVTVTRPAIQNVRINDVQLVYERDYNFDASTSVLTLLETAEANASTIRQLTSNLTFTNGSLSVTGTNLDSVFKPGYMVGIVGNADFFEVGSVFPSELRLRTPATFGGTGVGRYKTLVMGDKDVLTCDVLGRTLDGTPDGALIRNGPRMVRTLLEDMGLGLIIDTDSFDEASVDAAQDLGLVIPEKFDATGSVIYRDVVNSISKSINGGLIQTDAFNLSYFIIKPNKTSSTVRFSESDVLNFTVDTTSQNIVKTVTVNYRPKEYDYLTKTSSTQLEQKTSDNATYVLKTDRTKEINTKLVNQSDAQIYANRWSLLLESSAGIVRLTTKMQGALIEVGDVIDLSHRKLFVRLGGTDTRRLLLVEKVMKSGSSVLIEAVDLSNTFNRTATISSSSSDYSSATDEEKLYGGYFTDEYGLIDNDPETFGLNLIY